MLNLSKALTLTIKARENITGLLELEGMIRDAMAEEIARSKGSLNTFSALKKIIEKIKKEAPYRKGLHGAWIDPITEKQYVCTGYCLIEINEPIDGLLQIEDGETTVNPFPYFKEEYEEETPIDANQVKLQMKEATAKARAQGSKKITLNGIGLYKIGPSFYSVAVLADIISALGTDIVAAHLKDGSNTTCVLTSKIGRAYVCPVAMPKSNEEGDTE